MKNKLRLLLLITISTLLSLTVVYAAIKYDATDVLYDNTTSGLSSDNLKDAIDILDVELTPPTNCPSKTMTCKKNTYICKRATTLNTETCQQSSNYCGAVEGNGNTITYGQIGTSGVLTPGDAFDCKVSTSGGYSERFYYVSDYYDTSKKAFNSEVAVLIYSKDTKNGAAVEATTSGAAYYSTSNNYSGPVTAVTHLPTTSSWNNISLYKTSRAILTQDNNTSTSGGVLPTAFSYSGKAARLLTYQEVYQACYNTTTSITSNGGLNNCNFLFENTNYSKSSNGNYGPWLETPYASNSISAYNVHSYFRRVNLSAVTSTGFGVRPTIDVLKSDISY